MLHYINSQFNINMVWETCNIVLSNPSDGVFHTNSIVTGSVVLEVKPDRKIGRKSFIY